MSIAMSETGQVAPDAALAAEIDALGEAAEPEAASQNGGAGLNITPIRTIPLSALVRNPSNPRSPVRQKADADLLASVKENGFDPFIITKTNDPSTFMIMDGHRRMDVAEHLKLKEVPYAFDPALADDPVAHHLIAVITSQHKKPLTALETATALFHAAEAGASKTRLAKAYGKKHGPVDQALKVAKLPETTRSAAAACTYDWDIPQLAELDEFADDEEATARLMQAAEEDQFAYQVERERIERTEREQRETIRAEHEAAGVKVFDEQPDGALHLSRLRNPETGSSFSAEQHGACPGHAAVFEAYGTVRVSYYCLDPEGNGHELWGSYSSQKAAKPADKAAKRAVVQGNKDFTAAQAARAAWLRGLISGAGKLEKDKLDRISRFTTLATLTAPDPVRKFPAAMKRAELQADLLGMSGSRAEDFEQAVASASPRRLLMLQFATVAAAYEKAATKDTWRTDQPPSEYTGSDRKHTRTWLTFCREVGHNLSPIEEAIVADETYAPAEPSAVPGALPAVPDEDDEAGDAQDDADQDRTEPSSNKDEDGASDSQDEDEPTDPESEGQDESQR